MASSAETLETAFAAAVPTTCGALTSIAVKARKFPVLLDSEAAPLIVVTVKRDGNAERVCAGRSIVRYLLTATLIRAGGNKVATDYAALQWQEDAEAAATDPATYSGSINKADATADVPFDRGGLKATLDYTVVSARVEVIEERNY